MSSERILVTGATGQVGSRVVQELLKRGVKVTVYVRSPEKVPEDPNITIVQGDFSDLTPLENALAGHTRLFLLVFKVPETFKVKHVIAQKAYAAGVKQIVDLGSIRLPWRAFNLLESHQKAEKLIFDIPNRGSYVSLRPTNFTSNITYVADSIKQNNTLIDSAGAEELQEFITPQDIAVVAANIFVDPIEKHSDSAYELIGDLITPTRRAEVLAKALGRPITYSQLPVQVLYNQFFELVKSHDVAFFITTYQRSNPVSRGLPILLGREPQTFEDWVSQNIEAFQ
ncbi:hypothetical protein BDA99DRAFT_509729 [Phascolomyces articulosus]|uniref:NmrA-like domain-containing protein n=1 Tax=Phascolomyces articulosus TaxID=60185 RepID=A0AAD5PDY7_9FUNG|nr:hypothetical protein BDA99DRAFT_509729 [Phascolomyces articulosus]